MLISNLFIHLCRFLHGSYSYLRDRLLYGFLNVYTYLHFKSLLCVAGLFSSFSKLVYFPMAFLASISSLFETWCNNMLLCSQMSVKRSISATEWTCLNLCSTASPLLLWHDLGLLNCSFISFLNNDTACHFWSHRKQRSGRKPANHVLSSECLWHKQLCEAYKH